MLPTAALGPAGQREPSQEVPEVTPADYDLLQRRRLAFPVPAADRAGLVDTFNEARAGGQKHEAIDIPASTGSPVLAVDDGVIRKLFYSVRGGLTVYLFDPTGAYCYYYAHLERYAEGLKEGDQVRRGDTVGYVDSTGDAPVDVPHLHFAIYKLGPEKHWWQGAPINPFPILTPSPLN